MVSRKSRERMKEYVVERLEDSGIHVARDISRDCLQLKTNGEKGAYVFLHTSPEGSNDFIHGKNGLHRLVYSGNFVSNIFYKDGKNFFVLLDEDTRLALAKTTMKNYPYQEVCKMVDLRDKEREVLRMQGSKRLVYYQPDNSSVGGRLREGLVSFGFSPVQTSYSHKAIDDRGYDFIMADDGKTLLTRFISDNKQVLDRKLQLMFSRRSPHVFTLGNKPDAHKLSVVDVGECSGVDTEKYFLRQTGQTLADFGGDVSEYINPQ
jgi:hypothetical protein